MTTFFRTFHQNKIFTFLTWGSLLSLCLPATAASQQSCRDLFASRSARTFEATSITSPSLIQLAEMIIDVQDLNEGPLRTNMIIKAQSLRQEMVRRHGPTVDSLLQDLIRTKRQTLASEEASATETKTREHQSVRRLETKAKERIWQPTSSFGRPLSFVDNDHALFLSGAREIRLIHVKSGQILKSWQSFGHSMSDGNAAFVLTPDRKGAIVLRQNVLSRIDLANSHRLVWETFSKDIFPRSSWSSVAVTPDGQYLVAANYSGEEAVVDLRVSPAKSLATKKAGSTGAAGVTVSPDGLYAFAWHHLKPNLFYDFKAGTELPKSRLAIGDQLIANAQFIPGSNQLITINSDGRIRRFDIKKNNWIGPDIATVQFLQSGLFVMIDANRLLVSEWTRDGGRIRIIDVTRKSDLIEEMALVGEVTGKYSHIHLPESRLVLLAEAEAKPGQPLLIKTLDLDTYEIHVAEAHNSPESLRLNNEWMRASPDGEILFPSNYLDLPGYLE